MVSINTNTNTNVEAQIMEAVGETVRLNNYIPCPDENCFTMTKAICMYLMDLAMRGESAYGITKSPPILKSILEGCLTEIEDPKFKLATLLIIGALLPSYCRSHKDKIPYGMAPKVAKTMLYCVQESWAKEPKDNDRDNIRDSYALLLNADRDPEILDAAKTIVSLLA